MDKRAILLQLDTDPLPSVFDRIVALDAGADDVLSYGNVIPDQIRNLVHGAIFTRGPKDLHRTAIFIGGSDVSQGERILEAVRENMIPHFGLQVSVMLDSNGANTTAAAAVSTARKQLDLSQTRALVLGTGPVGRRILLLLAEAGAQVRLGGLDVKMAEEACRDIVRKIPNAQVEPVCTATPVDVANALKDRDLLVSAGPAGVELVAKSSLENCPMLRLAIDLNAAPPLGIADIGISDFGRVRGHFATYGAIGVGNSKMKIHKAALAKLFERNDQILDAVEISENSDKRFMSDSVN